jgi:hypothetical protein
MKKAKKSLACEQWNYSFERTEKHDGMTSNFRKELYKILLKKD